MKIYLNNDFDTYLIPNSEPTSIFRKFKELAEKKIKDKYPEAEIIYHRGRNLVITPDMDLEDKVLETVGNCFQSAYNEIADEHDRRNITIYICGKCGKKSDDYKDWLIAQRTDKPYGHQIIRCPECITDYARRLAGMKQQYYHLKKRAS